MPERVTLDEHDVPVYSERQLRGVLAARVAELEAAFAEAWAERNASIDRAAELQSLGEGILSYFHETGDGYRARAGQVQIARWQKALEGDTP